MTTSYRRFFLTMLATTALLVLSVAASGTASAASGTHLAADVYASNGNGNGNGSGGDKDKDKGGGQGTATPELPSGVLFSLGLAPLAAGLYLVWRRRQTDPA